jgi:hypothetical protein
MGVTSKSKKVFGNAKPGMNTKASLGYESEAAFLNGAGPY